MPDLNFKSETEFKHTFSKSRPAKHKNKDDTRMSMHCILAYLDISKSRPPNLRGTPKSQPKPIFHAIIDPLEIVSKLCGTVVG